MQIKFTKTDGVYTFSDALNLPDDHSFTEEELESMMQQRFDNWLVYINTPVDDEEIVEEPTDDVPPEPQE